MTKIEPDGAEEFYNLIDTLQNRSTDELVELIKPFLAIRTREMRHVANQKVIAQIALSLLHRRLNPLPVSEPVDDKLPF